MKPHTNESQFIKIFMFFYKFLSNLQNTNWKLGGVSSQDYYREQAKLGLVWLQNFIIIPSKKLNVLIFKKQKCSGPPSFGRCPWVIDCWRLVEHFCRCVLASCSRIAWAHAAQDRLLGWQGYHSAPTAFLLTMRAEVLGGPTPLSRSLGCRGNN